MTGSQDRLNDMRRRRGFVLPFHEHLADVDPEFLDAYDELVRRALGHGVTAETGDLPPRYRELVVSAILAFRGASAEGIARHLQQAYADGATEREALGAFQACMVPGGVPTLARGVEAMLAVRSLPGLSA